MSRKPTPRQMIIASSQENPHGSPEVTSACSLRSELRGCGVPHLCCPSIINRGWYSCRSPLPEKKQRGTVQNRSGLNQFQCESRIRAERPPDGLLHGPGSAARLRLSSGCGHMRGLCGGVSPSPSTVPFPFNSALTSLAPALSRGPEHTHEAVEVDIRSRTTGGR